MYKLLTLLESFKLLKRGLSHVKIQYSIVLLMPALYQVQACPLPLHAQLGALQHASLVPALFTDRNLPARVTYVHGLHE